MLRGFYTAASGMLNTQRSLEAISNNIANLSTSGYKTTRTHQTSFDRELILVENRRKTSGSFSQLYTDKTVNVLEQGAFDFTDSPLDLAIDGQAAFRIQAANGTYLTRAGQLSLDDEGYLSLGSKGRILGEDGPIQLTSSDFTVSKSGLITAANGDTHQLALTYLPADTEIDQYREQLFTIRTDGEGDTGDIPENAEVSVIQGAYERSNVNVATEMTRAIREQRAYEASSQMIKLFNEMNTRSSTELAKL